MREEFQPLYDKITDPFIFKQDKDYPLPKDRLVLDFLIWYRKETGNIEFTNEGKRFKVVSYPVSSLKRVFKKEYTDREIRSELSLKIYPVKDDSKPAVKLGHCTRMDIVNRIRIEHGMEPLPEPSKDENWEDEF